jgi:aspartyl-tRNA(Asn)/glutamyl-tRNA(Gln) amidotransferase subunit A
LTADDEAMSDELTALTAVEAAARIREKAISPVELTRAYLERIERLDERLNCYITVCHREAMVAAREAERAVLAGEPSARSTACRSR